VTRFTVVWHESAKTILANLWLAAADRQSIANAANTIDWELAQDPSTKGTLGDDNLRELIVPPLRVLFSVSEQDRMVKVTTVELV
jgi:hypothetical protein